MDYRQVLRHFVSLLVAFFCSLSLAQGWGDAPITYAFGGCGAGSQFESSSMQTTGSQICAVHPNGALSFVSANPAGPDTFIIFCSGGTEASPNTSSMYQCRKCPAGSTIDANNKCISSLCISQSGQSFSFDKVQDGTSCSGPAPESVCFPNGCRGIVVSGSRMGFTNANGSSACLFDGVARVSSVLPCQTSDTPVKLSSSSAVQSDEQAASAGGIGVSGQGTQSLDSINLARIATNTAKIAGTLSGTTGAGTGTGGSSFEGEEGSPLADGSGPAGDAVAGQALDANQAFDDQASALQAAPNFGGTGSRWNFSLNPFVPFQAACSHTWAVNFPGLAPQQFTLDVCTWGNYFRDFAYWAVALITAFGLWSILYAPRSN